ncbi:MAG: hypothetical protein CSA65_02870 [Proteobacteria bacterium]|nr:MAG: hypothetical protein CSA65_02870 [Pseudomonadota bacterium]
MNTAMQTYSTPVVEAMQPPVIDVESVLARAASYYDAGVISAAKELYEALLSVEGDEELGAARHGLARCAFARGELHEALGHLQLLLQREPKNAEIHNDLGVVFYKLGLIERAREQLERALTLDPNDMGCRRNLIEVTFVLDDLKTCQRHCEIEQAREPTVEIAEILEIVRSELAR